jgi:putrescine transport system permease protein
MLLMAVVLSFATSMLVRAYAWMDILSETGLLNRILLAAGLVSEPLAILNTDIAVCIAIIYCYLPLMILPLYGSFIRLDRSLLDAATDLGATPIRVFWQVTVPLSWPAIACGCLLVFIPAFGNFIIPDLLGGPDSVMIGKVLWADFSGRNWPLASAAAIIVLLVLAIPMFVFAKIRHRPAGENP